MLPMSAAELFDQVKVQLKSLPAEEQQLFLDRLIALEEDLPVSQPDSATLLKWPDIEARHRRIFGDQVLNENIVLGAREDEPR